MPNAKYCRCGHIRMQHKSGNGSGDGRWTGCHHCDCRQWVPAQQTCTQSANYNPAIMTEAAAILGRKGGLSRSKAKTQAARDNGRLGGRPKLSKHEKQGFCHEHGCYFVECGKLGHGEDYDPKETL